MTPRRLSEPDVNAQQIVGKARAKGQLIAKPCEHCGADGRVDAHHADYFKPLEITWLCRSCHQNEHSRLRAAKILIPGSFRWRRAQTQAA
jgi:hypothetical protein